MLRCLEALHSSGLAIVRLKVIGQRMRWWRHADGGAGQKNLGEPHRYEGHHKIALKQSHWSRRKLETGTHG
jgi:hypothetical protein